MSSGVPVKDAREGYNKVQLGPREVALPEEWDIRPVNELFEIEKNSFDPDGIDPDSEILLYSMPAFDSGREPIQTQASGIGSKKYRVPEDTILFPKLNIRKRRFWRVQHNHSQPAVCSTEFWPLVPKVSLALEFYHYYFDSQEFMSNPKVTSSSSTNSHKRVKQTSFEKLQLPIPPLPEQRRIADILSTVDEQIQQTDKIIKKVDSLETGFSKDAVCGENLHRTKEQINKNIGPKTVKIPKHWEVKSIGDIVGVKGGKRLPSGHDYADKETDYPYIRVVDFDEGSIDGEKTKFIKQETRNKIKKYTISSDDVYISIAGHGLGISGMVPEQLDGANLTENAAKLTNLSDILSDYLAMYLRSPLGQGEVQRFTVGSGQPKLALKRIKMMKIVVPPLEEQESLCDIWNKIRHKKSLEKENQRELKRLKRGLMQDLLTGKVRVTTD